MDKEIVETSYIPGLCNIGQIEIRRRFKIGFIGLALMVLWILTIELLKLPSLFKLGLFIPAFYMVSGFLQAFGKFCFVYGWKGVYSFAGRRKFKTIQEDDFLKKDKRRAVIFIVMVTLSSVIITIIYFLLPV
jgi:hypothetical protein